MFRLKIQVVIFYVNVQVQAVKIIGIPVLKTCMAELVAQEVQQHVIQKIHVRNRLENIVKDVIQVIKGLTVVAKVHVALIQH